MAVDKVKSKERGHFLCELNLTLPLRRLSLCLKIMAELPPNIPSGAVPPPPKKETGKVQPKKETVRISLPPKPSAAPTIKLPTLPPGGPTGAPSAPSAAAPVSVPHAPRPTAAAPPAPPTGAPQTRIAAAPQPRTGVPAPRPAAAPSSPTIKTLDKVLIYSLVVFTLAAVGIIAWGFLFSKGIIENPPT
jgi:hypothetical protein